MSNEEPQLSSSIDEISDGIYRISISVPPPFIPTGFSFNQYLIVDEKPLLYHTGPRKMFPLVREAIEKVIPVSTLSYIAFSHVEADECGSLNEFLGVAPEATAVCSQVAAMVSVNDMADRPPKALADGEVLDLGRHKIRWFDTPHLPHGWESGAAFEESTKTLLCGDLFTQPGHQNPALTESDILGPSEAFRSAMDYYAHGPSVQPLLARLAETQPKILACMHGSAWKGDGAALLTELSQKLKPV